MWINILVFSCNNCIQALYSGLKPPHHRHGLCRDCMGSVARGISGLSLCWFKWTTLFLHHVTVTYYIQRNRNISLFCTGVWWFSTQKKGSRFCSCISVFHFCRNAEVYCQNSLKVWGHEHFLSVSGIIVLTIIPMWGKKFFFFNFKNSKKREDVHVTH